MWGSFEGSFEGSFDGSFLGSLRRDNFGIRWLDNVNPMSNLMLIRLNPLDSLMWGGGSSRDLLRDPLRDLLKDLLRDSLRDPFWDSAGQMSRLIPFLIRFSSDFI